MAENTRLPKISDLLDFEGEILCSDDYTQILLILLSSEVLKQN